MKNLWAELCRKKISIIMNKRSVRTFLIILFWLGLWQLGAWAVGNHILLVGPIQVFSALARLLPEVDFWHSIITSFQTISFGFLAAFFAGIIAGSLAYAHPLVQEFLSPVVAFMKSVPVASFVILALIWMGSRYLSVLIAFLVVFPVIYVQTTAGLRSTDPELLEMAQVFHITGWRKYLGLYWPALLPYLVSSCRTALGMSWKSGIAAEVIGVPSGTIGEQLYLSKIYLSTAQLFAWTLVIILASAGFERLFLFLLKQTGRACFFLFGDALPSPFSRAFQPAPALQSTEAEPRKDGAIYGLKAENLSKHFGSLSVLSQFQIQFSSQQPNCIMGPSGSGKTTLLRILAGLEPPDSGSVSKTGVWPEGRQASSILTAVVFQENRLCESFSAVGNIRMAVPSLSRAQIIQELTRLLPKEAITRPVSTLSGGMKRRTAILRALLAPSDMIIMDEPFTGLDQETKQQVIQYIREKSNGKLLILSTHQEEDIRQIGGIRVL